MAIRFSIRNWLDGAASVAMLLAAGLIVWTVLRPATAPVRTEPALPDEPIALGDAPILGRADAAVAVIEFSDFECPYCGKFTREILPALRARYIDTGNVQVSFRHLPLTSIHKNAQHAAETTVCAAAQGKFWPLHDALFAAPAALDSEVVARHVASVGLDRGGYLACMSTDATAAVEADKALARSLGITGTPAFIVGRVLPGRLLAASRLVTGARPVDHFAAAIDEALTD